MELLSLTRRQMLGGTAGALFVLAARVPGAGAAPNASSTELQPLISILENGRIEITALLADMGQGVYTSMPLILADELDADWEQVDIKLFDSGMQLPEAKDPGMFIAASSRSIRSWFTPLREVSARARTMLITAAAQKWKVSPENCRTEKGVIFHPNGRKKLTYAEVASAASKLPVPENVTLKPLDDFNLIGKVKDRRDVPLKCTGAAVYAIDVKVPGLKFVSVSQGPWVGATLQGYDEAAALALPRVEKLFKLNENTLVAVAQDSWSAMRALEAAEPQYALKENADADGSRYQKDLLDALNKPGREFSVKAATTQPKNLRKVTAQYEVPFLAHATMEPMTCTAWVKEDGSCEIWAPTQSVTRAQAAAATALEIAPEAVLVHQTFLGGGFGRRAENDFVIQAALISKEVKAPVRLVWSRTEDIQHDFYRSAHAFAYTGHVNDKGEVGDIEAKITGASIMRTRMPLFNRPNAPIDPTVQSQLVPTIYDLGGTKASWTEVAPPIPVGYWRSVAHSQNTFAAESFIDELAQGAGMDGYEFRRSRMTDPRMLAVLNKAAELANWTSPVSEGRGRGIAAVSCYDSYFAQVIEVSIENGEIVIHHVVNVIDCGLAVQPDNVIAQVEGGVIFGLSGALYGQINLEDGSVVESNFGDYRVITLAESPKMTTHILATDNKPGGVGETSVPTCAPALANALFAITGKRFRKLPLTDAINI